MTVSGVQNLCNGRPTGDFALQKSGALAQPGGRVARGSREARPTGGAGVATSRSVRPAGSGERRGWPEAPFFRERGREGFSQPSSRQEGGRCDHPERPPKRRSGRCDSAAPPSSPDGRGLRKSGRRRRPSGRGFRRVGGRFQCLTGSMRACLLARVNRLVLLLAALAAWLPASALAQPAPLRGRPFGTDDDPPPGAQPSRPGS